MSSSAKTFVDVDGPLDRRRSLRATRPRGSRLLAASAWSLTAPAIPPERALQATGPTADTCARRVDHAGGPVDVGCASTGNRPITRRPSTWSRCRMPLTPSFREAGSARTCGGRVPFTLPSDRSATGSRFDSNPSTDARRPSSTPSRSAEHAGGALPFELAAVGARPGTNELVVRVDGRPRPTDLPPGDRPAGWWYYGGNLRRSTCAGSAFDVTDFHVRGARALPRVAIEATV